jgi:hypothetical protein
MWKRLRAWVSRRRIDFVYIVLVVAGIFAVYFLLTYGEQTAVDFMVSFTAGILGIMAGLSLDRVKEQVKDDRTKKDFLVLMRNELMEIRSSIPPQKKIPLILKTLTKTPLVIHSDVWHSFVASGLMRLLSAEQVTKLSSVYKFVEATRYEAEWIRRVIEESESIPDDMKAEKEVLNRRYDTLQRVYDKRGKQLTEEIDKILKEAWLSQI